MLMIDTQFELDKPQSHYEEVYDKQKKIVITKQEQMKVEALNSLKELEGWCTQFKASILIDLMLMVQPDTVVEIGVWGGSSLIPMAYALKFNDHGMVYGIDPWKSEESAEGMDGVNKEWWSNANHDLVLNGLQNKIVKYGLLNQVHLIKATSEDAPIIQNIDVLHIDGNHSEKTSYIDVTKWVPHVRKGGIIIFDDINWSTTTKAVNWLDEHCVKMVEFEDQCTWGIWVKKD